jgi:hypothetical protein
MQAASWFETRFALLTMRIEARGVFIFPVFFRIGARKADQ